MFAFGIWLLGSGFFALMGVAACVSKKAVRFWNISQQIQVSDVRKYNKAVAKMWFVFAVLFAALGLPVLAGQNSAWSVISILGGMFWAVALMIVYTRIEKKYRIY